MRNIKWKRKHAKKSQTKRFDQITLRFKNQFAIEHRYSMALLALIANRFVDKCFTIVENDEFFVFFCVNLTDDREHVHCCREKKRPNHNNKIVSKDAAQAKHQNDGIEKRIENSL